MKNEDHVEFDSQEGTFVRGAYILLFLLINNIAGSLLYLLVFFQFLYTVFRGKPHEAVLSFTGQLNHFIYLTGRFASYQSNEKPFPFSPWPDAEYPSAKDAGETVAETAEPVAKATAAAAPVSDEAPAKKAPAKKAPAKKAPVKKAPAKKRAPAKPRAPKAPPKDTE